MLMHAQKQPRHCLSKQDAMRINTSATTRDIRQREVRDFDTSLDTVAARKALAQLEVVAAMFPGTNRLL